MKVLVGFAGFGGVEIALREAGIEAVGIEIDPAIAEVNRRNGGHCLTADILDVDPADYRGYDLMHFSPPCPSFSLANQASSETELDTEFAMKIAQFIKVGKPQFFTLENVWLYRKSQSWAIVKDALKNAGYKVGYWHLNAANYGVPQTRKRMIVIARRDGHQPAKPWPTHSKTSDLFARPWRGWYEAIEDLIPELPETEFAPWQLDRMPEELKDSLISNNSEHLGVFDNHSPSPTVTTHSGGRLRAYILGQGQRSSLKNDKEPADTVTANNNQTGVKAYVINSQNTTRPLTVRSADEPMMTVNANAVEHRSLQKVILTGDSNGSHQKGGGRKLPVYSGDQPAFTIQASANRRTIRAGLGQGLVVSMTVRCLARFQDFPDWFKLPGEEGLADNPVLSAGKRSDRELACRGIGNALPPGVYRAVLKSIGVKS